MIIWFYLTITLDNYSRRTSAYQKYFPDDETQQLTHKNVPSVNYSQTPTHWEKEKK